MLKRIAVLTSVLVVITVLAGCGKQVEKTASNELQMQNHEMSEQGPADGQKGVAGDQAGNRGTGRGAGINPAEAKEACADKIEGDVCQFTVADETRGDIEISGVCKLPGQRADATETVTETELSCRPENGNMPNRSNDVVPIETNVTE